VAAAVVHGSGTGTSPGTGTGNGTNSGSGNNSGSGTGTGTGGGADRDALLAHLLTPGGTWDELRRRQHAQQLASLSPDARGSGSGGGSGSGRLFDDSTGTVALSHSHSHSGRSYRSGHGMPQALNGTPRITLLASPAHANRVPRKSPRSAPIAGSPEKK
jgi:hypothetical protein